MRRLLPTLRASLSAWLLLAAGASLAAAPPDPEDPLAVLQSAFARAVLPGEEADRYRDLFTTVLLRVQRSYARDVDLPAVTAVARRALDALPAAQGEPVEVFRKAVNEALRTLDPYSRYIDPRSHASERSDSSGSFGGLGLELESGGGAVRVVAPMPGSPAARAGLQAGDLIVRVNDKPLQGLALSDAIAHMRGEPGTPVSLTVRRTEGSEFTVSITREVIRRRVVTSSLEDGVLVLRIAHFSAPVTEAVVQAIADASAAEVPRGIVLDVRSNPGGLLREAVRTADLFLNQGEIVSLRGRSSNVLRSWQADPTELLAGVPMVVLVDGRSASASELLAAALQDNGRAVVMGQRSYGKGTVQSTFSLGGERGALKLTTSLYIGPSGRSVQGNGVPPDVELLNPAARPREASTEPLPEPRARVEQARCAAVRKAADPALACALAYLAAGDVGSFVAATADLSP